MIPLVCIKCQTPIPAQPEEVAWACQQCGQGLVLVEEKGLESLEIHYATGIPQGTKGKPCWVAQGKVTLTREIYGGSDRSGDAQIFWLEPRQFIIPAYNCSFESLLNVSRKFIQQAPRFQEGAQVPFEPVTLFPSDMEKLAIFTVLSIEADRKDMLKEVSVSIQFSSPSLWILP
jgi:hypothetical protein